ncbi:hypothetical protein M758_4G042100 [Ceratodon purpureus]|nr:hypothetical protein M758_4G042100 [Ceratodon purpureus]
MGQGRSSGMITNMSSPLTSCLDTTKWYQHCTPLHNNLDLRLVFCVSQPAFFLRFLVWSSGGHKRNFWSESLASTRFIKGNFYFIFSKIPKVPTMFLALQQYFWQPVGGTS